MSLLPATTDGPDATLDLGRRLAETWPAGTIVALTGDLGAGKTHLAKGVAQARGVDPAEVTSPTFTIVQEYADAGLVHLDLYRMTRGEEVDALGLDDLFERFDLALVEWPEHAFGRLPADTVWLRLEHLGGDRRRIAPADRGNAGGRDADGTAPPARGDSPLADASQGGGAPDAP